MAGVAEERSDQSVVLLESDASGPGLARRFLRRRLATVGRLVDTAELLVTELVTNALLHGEPPIVVGVSRPVGTIRVEVTDRGTRVPVVRNYGGESLTGRGLHLVETLAAAWGVDPRLEGKTVWFELAEVGEAEVGDRGTGRRQEPTSWSIDEAPSTGPAPAGGHGPEHEPTVPVVVLGVPVDLYHQVQEHNDALLRDLLLLVHTDPADRADLPSSLFELAEAIISRFADQVSLSRMQVRQALARRDAAVDLDMTMPVSSVGEVSKLADLLETADRLAVAGDLLAPSAPPQVLRFRRHYTAEVIHQLHGGAARPWGSGGS